jgi:hypothetical protein
MPTVPLRKASAGADSFGHTWPEDGSVVEVDYDQAMTLLAIPDAGFTVAEAQPEAAEVSEPDTLPDLSEVAPEPELDASPAPAKRPGRPRTAKP